MKPPLVVSIAMGYGHLRAAVPLAEHLDTPVLHADRAPLADPAEARTWARARGLYESISRLAQRPLLRAPFGRLLDHVTHIEPLHPVRDLSRPTAAVRVLDRFVRRGLGRGLAETMLREDRPLLTTFYAPAIAADHHLPREGASGVPPIWCLVTDTDLNRVWVPADPARSRIRYLAPHPRVVRRLQAYGVPPERIHLTGFPLPHGLVGGRDRPALEAALDERLRRLDPAEGGTEPPRLVFAVGGSGTQAELPARFLPSLAPLVEAGRLHLTLVAGIRPEVARTLSRAARDAGLPVAPEPDPDPGTVELLHEPELPAYFRRFEALLARTDILWTKPGELVFKAALGLPLVLAPPVGAHELRNARRVTEVGAALPARAPEQAAGWLGEWLEDGTLAAAASAGATRLPADGLYRIVDTVTEG